MLTLERKKHLVNRSIQRLDETWNSLHNHYKIQDFTDWRTRAIQRRIISIAKRILAYADKWDIKISRRLKNKIIIDSKLTIDTYGQINND